MAAVENGPESGYPLPICAIDGMAGVGKTAFAVRAAHRLATEFPDGQLFVRLHAHTPGRGPVKPIDVLKALLRETGMDPRQIPATLDEAEPLWRDRVAGKRMLMLLDDAVSSDQVDPLVPGEGRCAVLATSRTRLTALEGLIPISLDVLPLDQANHLFTRLTGRPETEPEATAMLMRLSGCLPLAIRLLAARLRRSPAWTVAHLAGELAAARDRSAAISADDVPLSAAFDISYNRLPTQRQEFFRYLGMHPGAVIDGYAAAALTGLDPGLCNSELYALFRDHLIDEPARGRYRFHDLIGDYARALAAIQTAADRRAAMDRLLNYYLRSARNAGRYLARHPHGELPAAALPLAEPEITSREEAAAWMTAERSNLHAAVDYASVHGHLFYASRLPAAMNGFMRTYGYWDEALALHNIALEAARTEGDEDSEAGALLDIGSLQYNSGNYQKASVTLTKALTYYAASGHALGQANALYYLGLVRRLAGNPAGASTSLLKAVDLYRTLEDPLGQANALTDLGYVKCMTSDFDGAMSSLSSGLQLYRNLDNQNGQANALNYLGVVQFQVGDYTGAVASQLEALNIYRSLGNQNGQANAHNYLAHVQYETGDFYAAASSSGLALELYRSIGNRIGEANAVRFLSRAQLASGDLREALPSITRALDLHRVLNDRLGEANDLNVLGNVQEMMEDYTNAGTNYVNALQQFRSIGERNGEAESLNNLGHLSLASSDLAKSLSYYEHALTVARGIVAPIEEARALEGIGRCQLQYGRRNEAGASLREALPIFQRLGSPGSDRVDSLLRDHDL